MLFNYEAIDTSGGKKEGSIDAATESAAISALQKRGLVIVSIAGDQDKKSFLQMEFTMFQRVTNKELVILSRQIATLFEAQVSALRIFRLLGEEAENPATKRMMLQISDDLQAGSSISEALAKHDKVFSPFFVNMVKTGEESGKLELIFMSVADYLDRTYEVTSKAKSALIYPSFIIFTFISVMTLMLVLVIPKLAQIITDSGQEIPIYTKVVIAISDFLINYGFIFLAALVGFLFFLYKYAQSPEGAYALAEVKLGVPYLGSLYEKLYLSRISDNLSTMIESGVPMVRAIELTSTIVENRVYEAALKQAAEDVRTGSTISNAFGRHDIIPGIITQMIKVGEESGELGKILKTMALFYRREVNNAVDALLDLIEPAMIVLLGLGVGSLLASVMLPILKISEGIE